LRDRRKLSGIREFPQIAPDQSTGWHAEDSVGSGIGKNELLLKIHDADAFADSLEQGAVAASLSLKESSASLLSVISSLTATKCVIWPASSRIGEIETSSQ